MKKIVALLFLSVVLFSACEGDQGPPGESGATFLAETFERTNVNFNNANAYTVRVPLDPTIFEDDVVLVYRLQEVDNGLDVWEPLPTSPFFFFNDTSGAIEGYLTYRFNFTVGDIDIIMDSDAPEIAGAEFTDNQTFRIVIVPSEQANNLDIDFNDFNAVQTSLNLEF